MWEYRKPRNFNGSCLPRIEGESHGIGPDQSEM